MFPDGFKDCDIFIEKGRIIAIDKFNENFDEFYDYGDNYIFPGFIDIHTHGAKGYDYSESSKDEILEAINYQICHGATSIMPTITSSTYEKTYMALKTIESAMEDAKLGKAIIGVHLEGPYFSKSQSGAQDKCFITAPNKIDYERLINRFGYIIKRWDYAPETDNNGDFCAYLKSNGIIPSAGHTDAKYDDMIVAKNNGCNLITHFYSCTSTITREHGFRKLGVVECGYLWDDIYIEIIADGKHLPKELLQLIFKLKNNDKIILVTDSLKVTGCEDKFSSVGSVQCVIEDGVCKLLDRSAFAGSIATADRLIKVCVDAGIDIECAVKMVTKNPAKLFQLDKGKISIGNEADLIVMDKQLNIKQVFFQGDKKCY